MHYIGSSQTNHIGTKNTRINVSDLNNQSEYKNTINSNNKSLTQQAIRKSFKFLQSNSPTSNKKKY